MLTSAPQLRRFIAEVVLERVPLRTLDAEIARLAEDLGALHDGSLTAIVTDVELLLAEYTGGHIDKPELLSGLGRLAPKTIDRRTRA